MLGWTRAGLGGGVIVDILAKRGPVLFLVVFRYVSANLKSQLRLPEPARLVWGFFIACTEFVKNKSRMRLGEKPRLDYVHM